MMKFSGSCHCGAVRFEINTDITELTTCDCSICVKKNALMTKVRQDQFSLIAGEDMLSEYRWNTKVARHFFCSRCGIYTFHKKRSQLDHYGINVFCLDGINISEIPIRRTDRAAMSVVGE